ncbi:ABC transporter permease [Streptomyces sp. NBC_01775]|uniref:ABC transporter permease n=1 Tax=Streptomyces sp. NBC_01775 TaxID=2975939 RepID=UPI002DD92897|nr:ABC transporter permease [Streptomyces sp. NBC_01775]WSB77064.1 ABC transporter permease [Streptomyces sp. NBC_01775]
MSGGPHTALLRTQLAGMLQRPGRLALTGLSVLIAAFVVFGTVLAQEITERTTLDHFSGTPAATSLIASPDGGGPGITEAGAGAARKVPGVAEATARTETQVSLAGVSDRLLQLNADPGRGRLSRVRVTAGAYPDGHREVAVNQQAARHWGIEPGDRLRMPFPRGDDPERTRTVTATVTGVVATRSDRMETAYAPAATINAMSRVKGSDRLDVRAEPGVSAHALSKRLSQVLDHHGTHVEITTGTAVRAEEAHDAVQQYVDFFRIIAMFLAVAVIAAALVATSTFRIVFAQRLRQLALLRAIGAHRRQLVRALAVEGAVVGLAAGTTGVLLALGAGHAAPVVAGSAGQDLSAPGVPVGAALAVVAGAVLVTVGAVLAPAVSAAGVSPLQALRSADTSAGERGVGRGRLGIGLVLATAAVGLVGVVLGQLPEGADPAYEPSGNLTVTVLSGTLAFLALITLGPLLVRPVLAGAGWPLRRLGPTGNLAVSGVGGAPRRAAAVSMVVALGVTLVSGTLVGITSMQSYADGRLAVQAPADFNLEGSEKGLDPDLVRRAEKLPQLADVTSYRTAEVSVRGAGPGGVSATDMDLGELPSLRQIRTATGDVRDFGPGRVILGATLAEELGVRAGDSITLKAAKKGSIRASVAATLPDEGPLTAGMVLAPADLDKAGTPPRATDVLANAAEGGQAGRNAAAKAITKAAGAQGDVHLKVLAEERERSDADISLLATTALGLLGLTVLIAVVGVASTTGLTVLERTRESGLLRALGLGRAGLRTMIGAEAGLYGVLGSVLGLALGVPYAWLAIRVLNLGAPLDLPYGQLVGVFVGLTALTALTGLLPARRAARVSPVAALGTGE